MGARGGGEERRVFCTLPALLLPTLPIYNPSPSYPPASPVFTPVLWTASRPFHPINPTHISPTTLPPPRPPKAPPKHTTVSSVPSTVPLPAPCPLLTPPASPCHPSPSYPHKLLPCHPSPSYPTHLLSSPPPLNLNLLCREQPLHQPPVPFIQPGMVQPYAELQGVAQAGVLHLGQGSLGGRGEVTGEAGRSSGVRERGRGQAGRGRSPTTWQARGGRRGEGRGSGSDGRGGRQAGRCPLSLTGQPGEGAGMEGNPGWGVGGRGAVVQRDGENGAAGGRGPSPLAEAGGVGEGRRGWGAGRRGRGGRG